MQQNHVLINDQNIIEIHVVDDQTPDTVQATVEQARELASEQRKTGKPVLVIDNLLKMGTIPTDARKLTVELIKHSDFDKFAVLGSGTLLRFGSNLMLQATGKGNHVKYFDVADTEECTTWLLSDALPA